MARFAYALIWLYVFTIPWENIITIPGVGTLSRYIGILAVAVGLLYVFTSGTLKMHRTHFWALGFVLLAAASFYWSIDTTDTLSRVLQYGLLFGFFWALFNVVDNVAQFRGVLVAYVLGCYVGVGNTVSNFLSGSEVNYQRYAADGFDPGDFSFVLAIGIVIAWYLALSQKGLLVWVYRVYPVLAVGVILLTAARAGVFGVALGLLFVIVTLPRASFNLKLLASALAVAALWLIPVLVPQESFARLSTLGDELGSGTFNDRTNIWAAGRELFSDHPWLGVGAGAFGAALEDHPYFRDWVAPHNVFISISTEMGILGLLLLIAIMLSTLSAWWQLPPMERLLWGFVLGILFFALMAQNWEWRKQTWLVLGAVLTHWKVLKLAEYSKIEVESEWKRRNSEALSS